MDKPDKTGTKAKKKQEEDREELKRIKDSLKEKYEVKKKRREEVQKAKKEFGQCYHPINIDTGEMQSSEIVAKKFEEQFAIIDKHVKGAGLAESSRNRIEKAKRAFTLMLIFINQFFVVFTTMVANLTVEQAEFFKEVIFPLCYLNMIWRRRPSSQCGVKDSVKEF